MAQKPVFEYFGWGEKDPRFKYHQPKPNTAPHGEGAGDGGASAKTSGIEMRGYGAATKGRKCRGPMA